MSTSMNRWNFHSDILMYLNKITLLWWAQRQNTFMMIMMMTMIDDGNDDDNNNKNNHSDIITKIIETIMKLTTIKIIIWVTS